MSHPALFRPDGPDRWIATEYARGPWDPRHCHGGPVSAFLARACERADTPDDAHHDAAAHIDWQITRLTIELTRPVPVGVPLTLSSTVERPGRKVSVVAASLTGPGRSGGPAIEVAKVRSLRVRRDNFALPKHPTIDDELVGPPGEGTLERVTWASEALADSSEQIAFHSHGAEHRIVSGSWNDPGPIKLWVRLTTCIVKDEVPSGVQRAAAAADFGNGVSSALDFNDFLYINPDLTVHLARPPVGEWIGMATHSVYGTPTESTGSGFAESALHDADGRVGRSVQSLLVERR